MTCKFTLAKFSFIVAAIAASSFSSFAQLEYGGEPLNWEEKDLSRFDVTFHATEQLDRELIAAQDAVTDPHKDVPYRFGWEWEVALSLENSGTWTDLPNGDRVWRLGIECPEATSLSFIFDRFVLAKGALLTIWDAERTTFKGTYTHQNNLEWETMGVGLIHTDKAIIELYERSGAIGKSELQLGTIVHGYRPIVRPVEVDRGPFGNSGNCNINVNCPEGADWEIEKRSVALIVNGGFAVCSGALVNNTAQDGTPYFLTANHCLGGQNNWVFYFNHETAGCSGNTGPTNQSISGSVLRANNSASDVALLELSDVPPANFNAQYSGWDNSDALTVTSAVGIHHPSGDVKKICFEEDAPFHQNAQGAACWYINQWEDGVTEGGSSGSPLFDQNHRIIGQLYGGAAACAGNVNNGLADWYGRFGVSWNNGNSASQRLRDWLDPLNTGVTMLDGYPEGFVLANNNVAAGAIGGVPSTVCGSSVSPTITIVNMGAVTVTSLTIQVSLNGSVVNTIPWTGSLATNQSTVYQLPAINGNNGANTIQVVLLNPNGVPDEVPANNTTSIQFNAATGPTLEVELTLVLDDYGTETTWELRNSNNQVLYTGGPYQDDADQTVITETFCITDGCYTFTVFDSWGDGMCCDYGNGGYTLTNWNGQDFASGGEFEDSESVQFCTDQINVEEQNQASFQVYPNPADQAVTINLPSEAREVMVYNALGQVVHKTSLNGQSRLTLATAEFLPGWYHITVLGIEYAIGTKLLIQR